MYALIDRHTICSSHASESNALGIDGWFQANAPTLDDLKSGSKLHVSKAPDNGYPSNAYYTLHVHSQLCVMNRVHVI